MTTRKSGSKSAPRTESVKAGVDRLVSHSHALLEQWKRGLSAWQDYADELVAMAEEAQGCGDADLGKFAVDSTALSLSFYSDQWHSWIAFACDCTGQDPSTTGETPGVAITQTQTIVFRVDQFSESCDPQAIRLDVSKYPNVGATALREPTSSATIPADNVRLTTLGSRPGFVYVSLVDLQSLLGGSSTIPEGTYTGSLMSPSTPIASIEVIFETSTCA